MFNSPLEFLVYLICLYFHILKENFSKKLFWEENTFYWESEKRSSFSSRLRRSLVGLTGCRFAWWLWLAPSHRKWKAWLVSGLCGCLLALKAYWPRFQSLQKVIRAYLVLRHSENGSYGLLDTKMAFVSYPTTSTVVVGCA